MREHTRVEQGVREAEAAPVAVPGEHTPGPWSVAGNTVYAVDGRTVGSAHWEEMADLPDDLAQAAEDSKRDLPEAQANARLIAAAPDLLVAAVSFVEWTRYVSDWIDNLPNPAALRMCATTLAAAVRKAEGRDA